MLADALLAEPNACVQVLVYCTVCVHVGVRVCVNVYVFKTECVCGRLNAE